MAVDPRELLTNTGWAVPADNALLPPFVAWFDGLAAPELSAALAALAPDAPAWRALFASPFVRDVLVAEPAAAADILAGAPARPPERWPEEETEALMYALRSWRRREMARLAVGDIGGTLALADVLRGLSGLADTALSVALGFARHKMLTRYGQLRGADGAEIPLCVVAMGKLGGSELNFSSDIDIFFAYPDAGESDGPRTLSASEYCLREARTVIELLDKLTPEGRVFRVDTRLRPFGEAGPLAISFAALERYLAEHGRDWERYAFVKARLISVAPCPAAGVFLDEVIRPFVYRGYSDFGVLESLRDMKRLIGVEVDRLERQDDLKRGAGGIREAEFIVQSWQLIRGGQVAALRTQSFVEALAGTAAEGYLDAASAQRLASAYAFLRQAENRLQAMDDQQTHTLPDSRDGQARLALAMQAPSWAVFVRQLDGHRQAISGVFAQLLGAPAEGGPTAGVDWLAHPNPAAALSFLGAETAKSAARLLLHFGGGVQRSRPDALGEARLSRFISHVIERLAGFDAPVLVLERALAVADAVCRRSAYLSLLNETPLALERLLALLAASGYLTEQLVAHPMLLDELLEEPLQPALLTPDGLRDAAAAGLDAADTDIEGQMGALVRFCRASYFRVAVADVVGGLPLMQVSDRLSDIATISLAAVLRLAWDELADRHGSPAGDGAGTPAFGVVAYGKLGGLELGYGSDLDIIFLHDFPNGDTRTERESQRAIDTTLFAQRLARRIVHLLEIQTGHGRLYEVDTRLRPSGRAGLLVSRLAAFARYQQEDAWTWEHQALTRARFVAGDPELGDAFTAIRRAVLQSAVDRETLVDEVVRMRARMRTELSKSRAGTFDLKQDAGGIADVEFLVQYLVLRDGARTPAVLEWTDNIRQLDSLATTGSLAPMDAEQLQEIYRAYRRAAHADALNGRPALLPGTAFMEARASVCALWRRELGVDPCAGALDPDPGGV